jgi:DNA-binding response OmpR family regulator
VVSADVLLVLSDTRLRAFALAQLQEDGYRVVALPALGPARGLLRAGGRPAVAVVDLADLSDEDVQELLRAGVPVVAVAGAVDRVRAQRLRVRHVLAKPVTVGQVVDRVRELLPPAGRPA